MTITHNTLNLIVQRHSTPLVKPSSGHGTSLYREPLAPAPPGHGTLLYRDSSPLPVLTSGDDPWGSPGHGTSLYRALGPIHPFLTSTDVWWPRLKICSNLFTPSTGADIWWLLKHVLECFVFTAHKRSCGKVMFLPLSVSHSVHGGRGSLYDVTSCLAEIPPWTETPPRSVKSGQYASYWNVFLPSTYFRKPNYTYYSYH